VQTACADLPRWGASCRRGRPRYILTRVTLLQERDTAWVCGTKLIKRCVHLIQPSSSGVQTCWSPQSTTRDRTYHASPSPSRTTRAGRADGSDQNRGQESGHAITRCGRTRHPGPETTLAAAGERDDEMSLTPGQRVEIVWQLTRNAWTFKDGRWNEPRLRRDVGRVIRRGR
jgi:hypothetical protein